MKAQEFSQFKDQKELTDWLIENHKIEGRKGALAWMRAHVPKESVYQRAILDYLRKEPGVWAYKAQAGPYQRGGVPDIIACVNGQFYAFEVKRPFLGEASELQKATLTGISAAHGTARVVSFVAEVKAIICGDTEEETWSKQKFAI
jgi:hypothetical protein